MASAVAHLRELIYSSPSSFSPLLLPPPSLPLHSPFSQCVAYIAAAEIPTNQLPELITTLLLNVTTAQNTEALKVASLEAIGYICEEIVSQSFFCQ